MERELILRTILTLNNLQRQSVILQKAMDRTIEIQDKLIKILREQLEKSK